MLAGEKGDPECHLKLVLDINYAGSGCELYINCSPEFEWIETGETTTCQLEKSSDAKDEYEMRKSKAKPTLKPKTTLKPTLKPRTTLKPTSKPKTAATSLPSKNTRLTIPSVESFTNGALVTGQAGKNKNAYERFITFDNGTKGEEGWVLKEYIPLLQNNYNFKLIDKHEEHYRAGTSADSYEYWFNYTGSGSAVKFKDTYAEAMYHKDIECNLRLGLWVDNVSGTYRVSVYYSPELSVTDTSDRTGYKLTGLSGGSSSGSSGGGTTPCVYCDRGRCRTCNGRGLVEKSYYSAGIRGKRTVHCGDCNNGKCKICGGDGWID